jgi:programmed cell death 6-interacting protein
MDTAFWKWREIADNAEEGIKFYNGLSGILAKFKDECSQFLNARRVDIGQLANSLQGVSLGAQVQQQEQATPPTSPPQRGHTLLPSAGRFPAPGSPVVAMPSVPSAPPAQVAPAPAPAPQSPPTEAASPPTTFLPRPSSMQWQSAADFLPPPVVRTGGIAHPVAATPLGPPAAPSTPLKVVRPSLPESFQSPAVDSPRRVTRASARQGPIGDPQNNPYKKGTGSRSGEGII